MQKLKVTQQKTIRSMLSKKKYTCTTLMAAQHITDYRSRLCELRKGGLKMVCRACETHDFHNGNPKEWKLI